MVLLLGTANGLDGAVFDSLKEIARCDPGLYTEWYTSDPISSALRVRYEPKNTMLRSQLLLRYVTDRPQVVVVIGVDSDYIIEPEYYNQSTDGPPGGKPIKGSGGGWTRWYPENNSALVLVDVKDGHGKHYRAPGNGGGTVYDSLPTILYHELSHAYHYVSRDHTGTYHDKEVQARTDENVFRAEFGLELLDVQNDDDPGLGMPSKGGLQSPSCEDKGWECGCNIATAALGSPIARPIAAFRRAKRDMTRLTLGSVPLLQPMLDSYQLFSPLVANDMRSDPSLRGRIGLYGVQPAIHLLDIVNAYIAGDVDDAGASQVDRSIRDYLDELPWEAASQLDVTAAAARQASRCLYGDEACIENEGETCYGIFAPIVDSTRAVRAETSGPAWILAGLALFLDAAANARSGAAERRPSLASALGDWLAGVPLPGEAVPSDELHHELARLKETVLRNKSQYDTFAKRVQARWPYASLSPAATSTSRRAR